MLSEHAGPRALEQKLLGLLPESQEAWQSANVVAVQMAELVKTDLYKFVHAESRGNVDACHAVVDGIARGYAPEPGILARQDRFFQMFLGRRVIITFSELCIHPPSGNVKKNIGFPNATTCTLCAQPFCSVGFRGELLFQKGARSSDGKVLANFQVLAKRLTANIASNLMNHGRLPLFHHYTVTNEQQQGKTHYGIEGLATLLSVKENAMKKDKTTITLDELRPLFVYEWLLSAEQKERVRALASQLMGGNAPSTALRASGSNLVAKTSPKKDKKNKKAKKEKHASAHAGSVMDLFE